MQQLTETRNVEYHPLSKVASGRVTVDDAYLTVLSRRMEEVNFKKQVICSKHWVSEKRRDLEDLPTIISPLTSSLSLRNKNAGFVLRYSVQILGEKGAKPLKYYRLEEITSFPEKRRVYSKISKSKGTQSWFYMFCSL